MRDSKFVVFFSPAAVDDDEDSLQMSYGRVFGLEKRPTQREVCVQSF